MEEVQVTSMKLIQLTLIQLTREKRTSIFLTQLKKDGDYVTQFLKVLREVFMLEAKSAEVTQLNSQITGVD